MKTRYKQPAPEVDYFNLVHLKRHPSNYLIIGVKYFIYHLIFTNE
jgi:hypothetical protein